MSNIFSYVLLAECVLVCAHESSYNSVAACLQAVGGVPGQQETLVSRVSSVRRPWARQASGQGRHLGDAPQPRPQEQRQESGLGDKGREKNTHWGSNPPDFLPVVWSVVSFDLAQPKTEDECVKVLRPPQPPESWGPAGHRGALANNETWVLSVPPRRHILGPLHDARQIKAACRTHNSNTYLNGCDSETKVNLLHLPNWIFYWPAQNIDTSPTYEAV